MEQTQQSTFDSTNFVLTQATVFLLATGVTLVMFSVAYADDMQTLRETPEAFWNIICGRPSESGIALPLLMTAATMSFLLGASAFGWRRFRLRDGE